MGIGIAGLMFMPIRIGALVACLLAVWYVSMLRKAQARHVRWSSNEENRRLHVWVLPSSSFPSSG
ncbi:hypothetical protein BDV23DRAFT_154770 [Aspergillus alliaceus]|uniref:Uncharacterized protein n=1 Tax=Petromyces alliaceus TaxID=209559 RepID=A0A5N7CA85_PETAA|nr:hypothetical protein BDV23DRAFT_154770 [Aspergillus alliaceus]